MTKPIQLLVGLLSNAAIYRRKIVAIDRARSGCHSAGWSLGGIIFIASNAILRGNARRNHFKEIELRGHLEQGPRILRRPMHVPYVARDRTNLESSHSGADVSYPLPERLHRNQFQFSNSIALSVYK